MSRTMSITMFVIKAGLLFDNSVFVDTRFVLRIDKIYPVIVNGNREEFASPFV